MTTKGFKMDRLDDPTFIPEDSQDALHDRFYDWLDNIDGEFW